MLRDGLKEIKVLADEYFDQVDSPDEGLNEEDQARLRGILDEVSLLMEEALSSLANQ